MREIPEIRPAQDESRPATVTAALWVGWSCQIMVICVLALFYLPQQKAYINALANKPNQQWTQEDINMFIHPDAAMIGTAAPFVVMFLLSAWLLHKAGQGRVWAGNVLIVLFAFRVMIGLAMNLNALSLLDVIAQVAVIVLLLMPASRVWFSAKNLATSGGAEDGYRVGN
jgi:hypothetical protein